MVAVIHETEELLGTEFSHHVDQPLLRKGTIRSVFVGEEFSEHHPVVGRIGYSVLHGLENFLVLRSLYCSTDGEYEYGKTDSDWQTVPANYSMHDRASPFIDLPPLLESEIHAFKKRYTCLSLVVNVELSTRQG